MTPKPRDRTTERLRPQGEAEGGGRRAERAASWSSRSAGGIPGTARRRQGNAAWPREAGAGRARRGPSGGRRAVPPTGSAAPDLSRGGPSGPRSLREPGSELDVPQAAERSNPRPAFPAHPSEAETKRTGRASRGAAPRWTASGFCASPLPALRPISSPTGGRGFRPGPKHASGTYFLLPPILCLFVF